MAVYGALAVGQGCVKIHAIPFGKRVFCFADGYLHAAFNDIIKFLPGMGNLRCRGAR